MADGDGNHDSVAEDRSCKTWEEVDVRFGSTLLFQGLRLCNGNWHAAQDLVQETLRKAYQAHENPAEIVYPLTYFTTALKMTWISSRPKLQTPVSLDNNDEPGDDGAGASVEEPSVPAEQVPLAEREELWRIVSEVADSALDGGGELVRLIRAGYAPREIAEQLEISPAMVSVAKAKLIREIGRRLRERCH
jgi:DNA-directed RNA polymerase specialized sigma24 family protein